MQPSPCNRCHVTAVREQQCWARARRLLRECVISVAPPAGASCCAYCGADGYADCYADGYADGYAECYADCYADYRADCCADCCADCDHLLAARERAHLDARLRLGALSRLRRRRPHHLLRHVHLRGHRIAAARADGGGAGAGGLRALRLSWTTRRQPPSRVIPRIGAISRPTARRPAWTTCARCRPPRRGTRRRRCPSRRSTRRRARRSRLSPTAGSRAGSSHVLGPAFAFASRTRLSSRGAVVTLVSYSMRS